MAYSTIDKSTEYFNTVTYTGDGTTNQTKNITFGFQPDWSWFKSRDAANSHVLVDAVRGGDKMLTSEATNAETTLSVAQLFTSTGMTISNDGSANSINSSGSSKVCWGWKAGGTAPSQTYTVKVVSDSGNKYRFDDFGTSAVTLDLQEGGTYTFDQSDSSNSGHPLRFSTTSNGSHGGGSEYTTGVTTNGTPGSSGAYTRITVAASAPTLYYYCTSHSGMGGQANTNSTFGSSNFSGSVQTTVSANTTAGFSIVSYTGTGANATVGHGLGAVPKLVITKNRSNANGWGVYHASVGNTKSTPLDDNLAAQTNSAYWNNTTPTSSVFSVSTGNDVNKSGDNMIAYCFAEKTGYSKFGKYVGNSNADGVFVYTGFKPSLILIKVFDGTNNWHIYDNKREGYNVDNDMLRPNLSDAEQTDDDLDILSNGFKLRRNSTAFNGSSNTYLYYAVGQSLVGSNNVPCTAR